MVRKLIIVLLTLASISVFSSCAQKEPEYNYVVDFKDAGLEYAVREQLKISDGDITYKDLKGLKIAYVWPEMVQFNNDTLIVMPEGTKVEEIDDLFHFANLAGLLVANTPYENVDVIADFKGLQRVILYENNSLTDISALKELPKLVELSVHDNRILQDFSVIGEIPTVVELNLSYSRLTDISFLDGLEALRIVYLNNNRITDFSPLAKSVNILEIDLGSNGLSDIGVLANFTKVYKLRLENNKIADISPLRDLVKISTLNLEKNDISDLSPLEGKPAMRKLWLDGNVSLSDGDVTAIREKLPENCEVVWSGK